jgi:hypothetical protein
LNEIRIAWISGDGVFKLLDRFFPLSLAAINVGLERYGLGVVREAASGDSELFPCPLIFEIDAVEMVGLGEMNLGQVRF